MRKEIQGRNRTNRPQSYCTYSVRCGSILNAINEHLLVDMMGSITTGILIIIVLLALLGLGWDTFVSGVKKGADKLGIMPIVQRALEIVENGTQNIVSNLRQ